MKDEGISTLRALQTAHEGAILCPVSVGGGNGALMAEILKTYPQPTGIVFDLPRAAPAAQQTIDAGGLGDRCRSSTAVPLTGSVGMSDGA
jgi:hypothetical protein